MKSLKLLTIAIPSYNSQDYMAHAIESLLPGGDEVEILIVDDGSKDRTAQIADEYERKYPGIVRAIHQENAGHGGAVMTGLKNASGLYFKVVDSDDWADADAYPKILEALRSYREDPVDMLISNYIYDKAGARHKYTMRYTHALPQGRVFGWEETRHFRIGQYILMHSVIYRTQLLRDCGLDLPLHTFYVDELYVYVPLKQALLVNRLLISSADPYAVSNLHKRKYMLNFLEIITTVSSVLLIKSGTEENLRKKQELWDYIEKENPRVYRTLRRRPLGRVLHLPGRFGRSVVIGGYRLAQKIFGYN